MNAKNLIRQFRAGSQKKTLPPLIHLCINLKSRDKYAWKSLKKDLINNGLHREYGIKNKVVAKFGNIAFEPSRHTQQFGNKTYLDESTGKFYTFEPCDYPF